MLRDLRVKVRSRHSRVSSCGWEDFLGLSKQFFAFLSGNSVLKAIVSELLARNPDSVQEARTADPDIQLYGETAEQAATLGYIKWETYASQDKREAFHSFAMGTGKFQEALEKFRDWYVEPLFDYLDEVLDDANVVLVMLSRYKQKVEWYRRVEVGELYASDTGRGEKRIAKHMYEFLFDQGLPFHVEPAAASGRPDVVSLEDSEHPFIGDVKIFDASGGRGSSYLKKGLYQVYRYCWDYNQPIGHLIVFNVSNKQLRFELPSHPNGVPRFEYNQKPSSSRLLMFTNTRQRPAPEAWRRRSRLRLPSWFVKWKPNPNRHPQWSHPQTANPDMLPSGAEHIITVWGDCA